MKNIFVIGESLIDMMMSEFPNYQAKFGGAPANVAVNTAKFGAKTYFLGNIANDYLGDFLYNKMKESNISLEYSSRSGKTSLAFVSWDNQGERDFQFYSEADQDYVLPNIILGDEDLVHFGSATAFLGNKLEESYRKLFNMSRKNNSFISFDPNYREDLIDDLNHFRSSSMNWMKHSNIIKLSLDELEILFGTRDYMKIKDLFFFKEYQIVIVTLGAKGSYIYYKNKDTIIDSIKVDQVDSTGAGDAFISAFLYQIAKHGMPDFNQACKYIELANKVGAITSTAFGAIDAVPNIHDL